MKNTLSFRFYLLFLIIFLSNCKDPSEGVIINVNTSSLFKSPFLVRFENANPNSGNKIGDFPITITGKDANLVQMGSGGSDFKVSQGNIPLALKSQAKPTPENPILFTINANIPGHEPISKEIVVNNDSSLMFVIPAFDAISKVDGTSSLTSETALKNGITPVALNFTTATNATLSEVVGINIPTGTEMRDGNQKIIDAEVLRATVIFYGNTSPALNAAFPYGLNTQNAIDKTGNVIPFGVDFMPAGVLRIEMFAGRTQVMYFSKPVEVTQELPAGLINRETNSPIKAGETIPIWLAFNFYWNYQLQNTQATVVAGSSGKLVARYTITSPAVNNLSWVHANPAQPLNKTLELNFNPSHSPFTGGYSVQAVNANNTYLFVMNNYQPQTEYFQLGRLENNATVFSTLQGKYGYSFPTSPNTSAMKFIVYSHQGKKVGESSLFNPTNTSSVNVDIDNSPVTTTPTEPPKPSGPIEHIKIKANFIGKCTNKNLTSPVNTWVTINNKTDNTSIYLYVKNGVIDNATNSVQLIVGHEYNMTTTYNGETYESSKFTLTKANQVLKTGANNFTATFTYHATTNSLELSGTVSQECK